MKVKRKLAVLIRKTLIFAFIELDSRLKQYFGFV